MKDRNFLRFALALLAIQMLAGCADDKAGAQPLSQNAAAHIKASKGEK